jgi:hypothetical protein
VAGRGKPRREEGVAEPHRERIEDFIRRWRSRYEGNRVFRVLAAVLLVLLLALRGLRMLRVLALPGLLGAILVVGWLLVGSSLTIPRFTTEGPVVRNGVAAVVACGEKRGLQAVDVAPEPRTGGWWPVHRGECTVWYHRPPDATQREARHERAAQDTQAGTQTSVDRNDVVWACGRKVLAEYRDIARDIARRMRKDCGIYGPQAAGTSGD